MKRPLLAGKAQALPATPRGRLPLNIFDARTIVEAKADPATGRLLEPTKYLLWGLDCPQPVMAAYERSLARNFGMLQSDGDLLVAWAIEVSLVRGDMDLGVRLREALEAVGWTPRD